MLVQDWMTRSVITANLRDGRRQTWDRMQERQIRHLAVVDDDERLAAIITDRDVRRPSTVDVGPDAADPFVLDDTLKVATAMTDDPVTLDPGAALRDAVDLVVAHKFGAIPVVDHEQRLVGLITTHDLLRAFRRSLA